MLRSLYDWTLSLAARKSAELWLAVIAFIESSVFLVPADVFSADGAGPPDTAYRYASCCDQLRPRWAASPAIFSGSFAYEAFAKPVLAFYGKLESFEP
jgi:hypothetical protein